MTHTTDNDYADLLARQLAPGCLDNRNGVETRQQEREWLAEDLMTECGEAIW